MTMELFRLKPTRAAKVSEISEATGASPVPPEDRINFHIGNPAQDPRLYRAFFRIALGLPQSDRTLSPAATGLEASDIDEALEELGAGSDEREQLEFLSTLIVRSAPYMPRGGYQRTAPNELVRAFSTWLEKGQPDPLSYDLGQTSGTREVILATGGIIETFRVFLHATAQYLVHTPADLLLFGLTLPDHLRKFPHIRYTTLPDDESVALQTIEQFLTREEPSPVFLALGRAVGEETRRLLWNLALHHELLIIEANDAPNSSSMARESRMSSRVLRFLTPGIFSPTLATLPTVFVAGNADFVGIIEVAHFQLKGAPSAPETEHLAAILRRPGLLPKNMNGEATQPQTTPLPVAGTESRSDAIALSFQEKVSTLHQHALYALASHLAHAEATLEQAAVTVEQNAFRAFSQLYRTMPPADPFLGVATLDLLDRFFKEGREPEWQKILSAAFLSAFLAHHPEYDPRRSRVVSGSSRTALGLIGFHCGISSMVIPDLSWTYEHCFPHVASVPLTNDYQLDVDAIIAEVQRQIQNNPSWKSHGAVALNNPHNATGQAFHEADVRRLLQWLLTRGITAIDDLAYQNVAASDDLVGPPTLRNIADALCREGYITNADAAHVVTVQSVSKTDCLAGSRLAVVEIPDEGLLERFDRVNDTLTPNIAAILLSYLFYRGTPDQLIGYWRLRNHIFNERMTAIERAASNLPQERNLYGITISRPTGSMYPLMAIPRLPNGLSLDWLSSGLARQGIGLLPLSAFARSEKGFEAGRSTFRLTLGGVDGEETLFTKTRRVLIDLNRMIADEESRYNRVGFPSVLKNARSIGLSAIERQARTIIEHVRAEALRVPPSVRYPFLRAAGRSDPEETRRFALHLHDRFEDLARRIDDRARIAEHLLQNAFAGPSSFLADHLERELYKDSLPRRSRVFRHRLFDRTVHPTQMYSLEVEQLWEQVIQSLLRNAEIPPHLPAALANALAKEYAGTNVTITSRDEPDELLLDLRSMLAAEDVLATRRDEDGFEPFLSYWGDWDGSTRPSGQGHVLVASALIENIRGLAHLVTCLLKADPSIRIDRALVEQVRTLDARIYQFRKLIGEITALTHQLERRYRGVLPWQLATTRARRLGMKLRIARDPVAALWQHNDRLERRMLTLREKRKEALHYYFGLNKALRKSLHGAIPSIVKNAGDTPLTLEAVLYRDLLKRIAITPRIHQKLITGQDAFAIDTTVHNINEINAIAGTYGNPGMILGLQISMSTSPDALILADRKLRSDREEKERQAGSDAAAPVWLIPLFEDIDAVKGIGDYLTKIWEYSVQSRRLGQDPRDRFSEVVPEVFVAGSDLSQQVGQTAGMTLFREAKQAIVTWLAGHDLVGLVRIKMGSGEPMQRQGGYYAPQSGLLAFSLKGENEERLVRALPAAAKKSAEHATTPLLGVFAAADLRTYQSNIAERLRSLSAEEYARLLFHVYHSQRSYEAELARAAEPLVDTRLQFSSRGLQEIERLTLGKRDKVFDEFVKISTENFRHIVYGRKEDVVGLHIISYFIARTTPPLRDRPTFRPGRGVAESQGKQIIERIAETIPLSKYGTLLRAIAHNQAQTSVLGVNQLTTGLFRTFHMFAARQFPEGTGALLLADRVLPNLPVYEILHSLRAYHDVEQRYVNAMERAFPAGNSAFSALREDVDVMDEYLGLLRRELVRRHGVNVSSFFDRGNFNVEILPALRPDLAVLLQPDLFNTDPESLFRQLSGSIDEQWRHDVARLLTIPRAIAQWRERLWSLLHEPVFARVESFVELAVALSTLSDRPAIPGMPALTRPLRPLPSVKGIGNEDTMQQFLNAAFEYLTTLSQQRVEVPTTVVKALHEVERIMDIEKLALSEREQEELRFYLLQIARLAGDNG